MVKLSHLDVSAFLSVAFFITIAANDYGPILNRIKRVPWNTNYYGTYDNPHPPVWAPYQRTSSAARPFWLPNERQVIQSQDYIEQNQFRGYPYTKTPPCENCRKAGVTSNSQSDTGDAISIAIAAAQNEGRHLSKHKCQFGACGGGNFGGGFGNYGGYQQGYPYPPINIGISQSQASSPGYNSGYYPFYNQNNQYNGYPSQNYGPYSNFGPYGPGFGAGGYGPYNRPFGNGFGPGYNNQFNGNYYLGDTGNGYGLVKRFSDNYEYDNLNEDDERSANSRLKQS
ncbi:unnamed protein product [Leptosia nina]|uniref:Uncharacterized protein n=1 Tax=Leptosia nina TaxID=320188 RepID=A0AAV1J7I7_9NEOP